MGFDPTNVVQFELNPAERGYTVPKRDQLIADAVNRLSETAGFMKIAYSSPAPISTSSIEMQVRAAGMADAATVRATSIVVSPRYFETLSIALFHGRTFTGAEFLRPADASDQPVVVSESLAHRMFGAEAVVGRQIDIVGTPPLRAEIVGVVNDVKSGDLRGEPRLTLYKPSGQIFVYGTLLVRSPLPTEEVLARGRRVLHELAPTLPIYNAGTVSADLETQLTEERVLTRLIGIVAIVAGLLALGGLYAVIAYPVKERTRELGIRLALGASSRAIVVARTRACGVDVWGRSDRRYRHRDGIDASAGLPRFPRYANRTRSLSSRCAGPFLSAAALAAAAGFPPVARRGSTRRSRCALIDLRGEVRAGQCPNVWRGTCPDFDSKFSG